jgi:hypothetical protein
MSCQRVQSLLSAYMDGEVDSADTRMLEKHLAECASCSHELALLQVAARMLATAPEVEPPASLLEQIEVATIRRRSVWQRLSAGFGSIPAYGRWAAATTAAAAILLAIVVSRPPHYTAQRPAYQPQPPVATAPQITEIPTPPTENIARQPVRNIPMHRYSYSRRPMVAEVPAREQVAESVPVKPARAVKPVEAKLETLIPQPVTQQSAEEASEIAVAPTPPPAKEIIIVRAADEPVNRIQRENDSLAKLRSELAARNKGRRLQVKADPIVGHKVSVELASIRF